MTRQTNLASAHTSDLLPPFNGSVDSDDLLDYVLERSLNHVQVAYIYLTPDLARLLLELVDPQHQRKINEGRVQQYASDMRSGLFRFAESAIVIDSQNHLVNGQHRLSACVRSGCGIYTAIVVGVEPDDIKNMDQGLGRTAGANLKLEGVENYDKVAHIAKCVIWYDQHADKVWAGRNQPTKAAIQKEVLGDVERYEEAARRARAMGSITTPSVWGSFLMLAQRQSNHLDRLDHFEHGVKTGADLQTGSPMLAFRSYRYRNARITTLSRTQADLFALLSTWEKYVTGQSLVLLKSPNSSRLPMPELL